MRRKISIIQSEWTNEQASQREALGQEWQSEDEMYQTFDFRLDDVFWSEANDRT